MRRWLIAIVLLLGLPARAAADGSPDSAADTADLWSFRVAVPLYLWVPDLEGTLGAGGAGIDFDLSHGDVIDLFSTDLSGFWTFFGDVTRDRVRFSLDMFLVSFDDVSLADVNLDTGRSRLDADQAYTLGILQPALSYRLVDEPLDVGPFERFTFEPLLALRYVYFDAEAQLVDARFPGLEGRELFDTTEHYVELLPVGGRFDLAFLEKWSLRGRILLGGWGLGDSDHGTDGMADLLLTYRFGSNWTAQFGVRWYDMNVAGNDLDLELRNLWGPVAGLIWSF